jgi:hypothetical protein
MKNVLYVLIAALLVAATVGCSSSNCGQRRSWFSWFNRGDSCRTCAGGDMMVEGPALGSPILNNVPLAPRSSNVEMLPQPVPLGQ